MWLIRRNPARRIRSSGPYWLLRNGMGDARKSLDRSIQCDIAIIGAGITGALIADALMGTGRRIVMLDARDAALGSTSASTAILQYEIDTPLVELAAKLGAPPALRAYQACAATFGMLESRFPDLLRVANYRRQPSLYLAEDEAAVPGLRAEFAARRAGGFECEWLEGTELLRRFGCRRPAAILSTLGAELDPVRFTHALLAGAERHGLEIFARSRVTDVSRHESRLRLTTDAAHTVDAAHVIVAAGFESVDFLDYEVARLHNTYAVVTEPLPDPRRAATMPLIWETARPYLYVRGTPDGRLLVGGADIPFKSDKTRDLALPRQVQSLVRGYRELFGEELPAVTGAWGGSFAATPDGLPFIGAAPGMHPGMLFALCFGGNGITFSVLAGPILRAAIEQREHELAGLFGFARLGDTSFIARRRQAGQ